MNIWRLGADNDHYKDIVPVNSVDLRYFDIELGAEFRKKWQPFPIKFVDLEAQEQRKASSKHVGDITILLSAYLMCSAYALEIMRPAIENYIRIYPLEDGNWSYVEISNEVDCFDYAKSAYELGAFRGFRRITRYVFRENCLDNQPIFTMPGMQQIFISDELKTLINDNDLRGLQFTQIVDTDQPRW